MNVVNTYYWQSKFYKCQLPAVPKSRGDYQKITGLKRQGRI